MEFYDRSARVEGSHSHLALKWNRTPAETGLEEPLWRLRIGGDGSRELYPERPGELDCPFYMRTGLCGYGGGCRFNHPGDRNLVRLSSSQSLLFVLDRNFWSLNLRLAVLGEYPERVGEPVCQYFLKTGTCKFGATCKFHHPKNGSRNTLPVNYLGYPLRPVGSLLILYVLFVQIFLMNPLRNALISWNCFHFLKLGCPSTTCDIPFICSSGYPDLLKTPDCSFYLIMSI
ncbi:putative zinc finger CCCH domain-containing protein 9 [Nymphaea thermarum]|nr:putative zinc finger CCCH domain-containing protein 9 [Nymphaea thermarum]